MPLFAKRRVIALRSVYSGVAPVSGATPIMPFYRLPESRGSSHFAGYTDRYRDQQLMLARISTAGPSSTRWTSPCTSLARSRRTPVLYARAARSYGGGLRAGISDEAAFRSSSRVAMKSHAYFGVGLISNARNPSFVPERFGLPIVLLLSAPTLAWCGSAVKLPPAGPATTAPAYAAVIDDSTWVDHDRDPIAQPVDWQPSYWGRRFHQGFLDPVSHLFDIPDKLLWGARAFGAHTAREAVNVNAFDEVPNSTWFTNRNNALAVPVAGCGRPDSLLPTNLGDKAREAGRMDGGLPDQGRGRQKWIVKLDPRGYPQPAVALTWFRAHCCTLRATTSRTTS